MDRKNFLIGAFAALLGGLVASKATPCPAVIAKRGDVMGIDPKSGSMTNLSKVRGVTTYKMILPPGTLKIRRNHPLAFLQGRTVVMENQGGHRWVESVNYEIPEPGLMDGVKVAEAAERLLCLARET